uniref:Uncharacterized protein n=1 Tax=Onchocerca volvulus TaxID=6282 RepID=A0A8R1TUU2_ONCVO
MNRCVIYQNGIQRIEDYLLHIQNLELCNNKFRSSLLILNFMNNKCFVRASAMERLFCIGNFVCFLAMNITLFKLEKALQEMVYDPAKNHAHLVRNVVHLVGIPTNSTSKNKQLKHALIAKKHAP